MSRAIDDSGNIQDPPTRVDVVVGSRVEAGPGGPVLVLVNGSFVSNPFGGYLAEILRAEGLNAFSTLEWVSVMDAADPLATLRTYAVVILAETALKPDQQQLIREFIDGGGSVIVMRPDPSLADVFGVVFQGTQSETAGLPQFLRLHTENGPGTACRARRCSSTARPIFMRSMKA
jgi:hypothetical protein